MKVRRQNCGLAQLLNEDSTRPRMRAFEPTACSMHRALPCAVLIGCLSLLLGAPVELDAKSRDSDASRMQARKIDAPSSHTDSLNPPDDRVDWRYFKLSEAARVSLSVKFDSDVRGGELGLAGATGPEMATVRVEQRSATIDQRLDPGVYYVRVQAETKAGYRIAVRQ
jgi:hypothetical protein